jgi:hypothetical protein
MGHDFTSHGGHPRLALSPGRARFRAQPRFTETSFESPASSIVTP